MKAEGKLDQYLNIETEDSNSLDNSGGNGIIDIIKKYNEGLPEDLGDGMTLCKCVVDKYKVVYTICMDGKHPSDFNDSDIDKFKESFIYKIKNGQNSIKMQNTIEQATNNGYDIVIQCKNNNNIDLFSISILPYEL